MTAWCRKYNLVPGFGCPATECEYPSCLKPDWVSMYDQIVAARPPLMRSETDKDGDRCPLENCTCVDTGPGEDCEFECAKAATDAALDEVRARNQWRRDESQL